MTDIVELAQCQSTQDEVRARLQRAGAGAVVAVRARSQVAGRGRQGRTWQHPAGAGQALLVSIGRRGPLPANVLHDLPRLVAEALLAALDAGTTIAWKSPNDLVCVASGAKVAGVLVDARTTGALVDEVVVGVGCNVAGAPFTTTDGRAASSAAACRGAPLGADAVAGELVARVTRLLLRPPTA